MQLMTSMRREGIHDGKETLIARLMEKRLGVVPPEMTARLNTLSSDDLDDLGVAILDFSTLADLESWLSRHLPN